LITNINFENIINQIPPFFGNQNNSSIIRIPNLNQRNSVSRSIRLTPVLERDISERKQSKLSIGRISEQIIPTRRNTNFSEDNIEADRIFEEMYGQPDKQEFNQFRLLFPNKSENKQNTRFKTTDNIISTDTRNQRITPTKIDFKIKKNEVVPGNEMMIENEGLTGMYQFKKILKVLLVGKKCVLCDCDLDEIVSQKEDEKNNICKNCLDELL